MQNNQTTGLRTAATDYVTIVEQACDKVTGFTKLYQDLERAINVSGKSKSTLINYGRQLAHLALHFNQLPTDLDSEQVLDYLHFVKSNGPPSASFFKFTVYGMRAACKLRGLPYQQFSLPSIGLLKKRLPKQITINLLNTLYKQSWVVFAKRPFENPKSVIEYLGRYTHKIAISNHRLRSVENGCVAFTYKDYRQGAVVKTMQLEAMEFIRRFSLHILPKGFVRIRHYGILSSTSKAKMRYRNKCTIACY